MDYQKLNKQLKSLIETPHLVANLANASALLFCNMPNLNWAGFYLVQNEKLVLGPFQGKPACIEIEVGKGVCGTAVKKQQTIVVDNVHNFEGHIACDCNSNAEIVVPIFKDNKVFAVLDVDSPNFSRFTQVDKIGLEEFCKIIEETL